MYRKSALALVALFGLAAAKNNGGVQKTPKPRPSKPAHTPKPGKNGNGGGANANSLKKVSSYQLCAGPYPQYVNPNAGQGAFTFPVRGETCGQVTPLSLDEVDAANYYYTPTSQNIGVLSGVCGMNPYAGRSWTIYRELTGGVNNKDQVGQNECTGPSNCDYFPAGYPSNMYPQFVANYNFPVIPQGSTSAQVQTLATNWCAAVVNSNNNLANQLTTCYGTLALRGPAGPQNKYPGSELDLVWNSTTTYEYVGATYTTDTQYGISGTEFPDERLGYLALWGFTVFDSITCQAVPKTITHTPATVYGGSGKYEKTPGAYVDPVTLTTTRVTASTSVANQYNQYQNTPLGWVTNVAVNYIKNGGYLHYSLL